MRHAPTTTRRTVLLLTGAGLLYGCSRNRFRVDPVIVGEAEVLPDRTIMDAVSASADHARLAAALRKSGLDEALSGPGPFTLLAPTDRAFARIRPKAEGPRVTGDPEVLKRVLRGHVLPAKVSGRDIAAGIDAGGGETRVLPLNGVPVAFAEEDGQTRAYDSRGRRAVLGPMDAIAANGLIHVIDEVLLLPAGEQDEAAKVSP